MAKKTAKETSEEQLVETKVEAPKTQEVKKKASATAAPVQVGFPSRDFKAKFRKK